MLKRVRQVHWLYVSESSQDLLGMLLARAHHRALDLVDSVGDVGYDPQELMGRSALELVHPDELKQTVQIH